MYSNVLRVLSAHLVLTFALRVRSIPMLHEEGGSVRLSGFFCSAAAVSWTSGPQYSERCEAVISLRTGRLSRPPGVSTAPQLQSGSGFPAVHRLAGPVQVMAEPLPSAKCLWHKDSETHASRWWQTSWAPLIPSPLP